jgi:D-glycero-D-manno-heptose 1,7-bisphosphate phosphatase
MTIAYLFSALKSQQEIGIFMQRCVFMDRDGVIIRTYVHDGKPYAITAYENLDILDGVPHAITRLKEAGYMMMVVSNQPDVAAGKVTLDVVEAINADLMEKLNLDEIMVCYDSSASCYKPNPGMLLEAAEEYGIDLGRSYMVGDRWRDIGAGKAAGCLTIFIDKRYSEQAPEQPDHIVQSLPEAAELILSTGEQA